MYIYYMEKLCKLHGLTSFSEGERPRCRKCMVIAVNKRRRKVKLMAIEYKGGKCENCGYDKCQGALDFHHLEGNLKSYTISYKGHTRAWEEIKKELDKCILLCANCHRELHSCSDS